MEDKTIDANIKPFGKSSTEYERPSQDTGTVLTFNQETNEIWLNF